MADLETLQTRLAEAEAARHSLAMGERVIEVLRDGRRMTFQASNRGDLDAYISELKASIADLEAVAASALPRRRFMRAAFY